MKQMIIKSNLKNKYWIKYMGKFHRSTYISKDDVNNIRNNVIIYK